MNFSLIDSLSRSQLRLTPFPHYIISNALPSDQYDYLSNHFPDELLIQDSSHVVNDRGHTKRLLSRSFSNCPALDPAWSDFADTHTSSDFFQAITSYFFKDEIDHLYPSLRKKLKKVPLARRKGDQSDVGKLLTDFQIVANLPQEEAHVSRSPHLDNPQQLYALLFYMRRSDDSSIGGGLNLFAHHTSALSASHGRNRSISEEHLELIDTLHYASNTAILFLNTRSSYHSVQPIFAQSVLRRSINIIGELPPGSRLFSVG